MDEITVDRQTLKALGADTRIAILKNLARRRMTQAELAESLGIAAPPVNEHLRQLQNADLITVEETSRKWKYYSLTTKGAAIVEPSSKKIWFLLTISLIALVGSLASMYIQFAAAPQSQFSSDSPILSIQASQAATGVPLLVNKSANANSPVANAEVKSTVANSLSFLPVNEIVIALMSVLFVGYCAGVLLKRG